MNDRSVIDLFAGCGGLSLGLRQAGWNPALAIEIDREAADSYESNHPDVHVLRRDIREVVESDLAEYPDIDLIAGCAPCQGFASLTAKHRRDDPRNQLVLEMARVVEAVQPSMVFMENVPGLARRGRALLDEFIRRLEALGYLVNWRLIQMADYGVPQNRRRLVLVAGRGFYVRLPQPSHSRTGTDGKQQWKTLWDIIGHSRVPVTLKEAKARGGPRRFNWHVVRDISDVTLARLSAAQPGRSWEMVPEEMRPECHQGGYVGFTNVYGRMSWDQLPVTITGGCTTPAKGRFGHPDLDRTTISVREAAAIQTFPPRFKFATRKIDKACEMIGNAVPPVFAEAVGVAMLNTLERHETALGSTN